MHWLTLIILSLLLASCGDHEVKPPPNTGIYAPTINPQPTYFMTVTGNIDPALNNFIHLTLIATYYTTNPKCSYVINSLEGVSSYRISQVITRVNTDNKNKFSYSIPLDLYLPSYCGWMINNISYKMNDKAPNYNSYSISSFINKKTQSIYNLGRVDWFCKKGMECKTKNIFYQGGYDLSPTRNYIFTINLRENNDKDY